jgi:hypothetical protein
MTSNAKRRRNKKKNQEPTVSNEVIKDATEIKTDDANIATDDANIATDDANIATDDTKDKELKDDTAMKPDDAIANEPNPTPRKPRRRKENIQLDVEESDDEEPPTPRKRSNSFTLLPDLLLAFNKIMTVSQMNPSNLMPTVDAEIKRLHKIIARSALEGSLFPSSQLDANNPFTTFMQVIASKIPLAEQSTKIIQLLSGQNPFLQMMTSLLSKTPPMA